MIDANSDETPAFIVDLDGFEGPLDLLLDLARRQKVNLAKISILQLAEQYLEFLREAQALKLEIAAEYLVMAAWLAFLKSQLLLPQEERDDDDVEEMAEVLADRLRKLDAIRKAAAELEQRPRLGSIRFARGAPEAIPVRRAGPFRADLARLLTCYGQIAARRKTSTMTLVERDLISVDQVMQRLSKMVSGRAWRDLSSFLPPDLRPGIHTRSAVAAAFVASLELAKRGEIDLQQERPYAPLMIKRR